MNSFFSRAYFLTLHSEDDIGTHFSSLFLDKNRADSSVYQPETGSRAVKSEILPLKKCSSSKYIEFGICEGQAKGQKMSTTWGQILTVICEAKNGLFRHFAP